MCLWLRQWSAICDVGSVFFCGFITDKKGSVLSMYGFVKAARKKTANETESKSKWKYNILNEYACKMFAFTNKKNEMIQESYCIRPFSQHIFAVYPECIKDLVLYFLFLQCRSSFFLYHQLNAFDHFHYGLNCVVGSFFYLFFQLNPLISHRCTDHTHTHTHTLAFHLMLSMRTAISKK